MKKIAITGASGFVGTKLTEMFSKSGYEVIGIKRGDLKDIEKLTSIVDGCEAVINLAGANIIHRWSDEYKKVLYSSRIDTTKSVVDAISKAQTKPKTFISTSAIGIYGNKQECNEDNIEYAEDFLGGLCQEWEKEAFRAKDIGVRTVVFRFGIVMGGGGALSMMLPAFKLGIAGTIGDGSQSFSFIHIDDLKSAFMFMLENMDIEGVYNLTAPTPTTNYGLTKTLGKVLNRPTLLPLPHFVLKIIFSEGATVLTDGQAVIPKKLLDAGFEFKYKTIEDTIADLV